MTAARKLLNVRLRRGAGGGGVVGLAATHSDTLAASYGVNLPRLNSTDGTANVYGNTTDIVNRVVELGCRLVRFRLYVGNASHRAAIPALYAAGVKTHVTVALRWTDGQADIQDRHDEIVNFYDPAMFQSVAGPNEPNASGRPTDWATVTRNQQQWIWNVFKGDPATAGINVVGPAFMERTSDPDGDAAALGNIASWVDWGDYHHYPSGTTPTTRLDSVRARTLTMTPGRPLYNTESGYNTRPPALDDGTGGTAVTQAQQAAYAPRQLLENYRLGTKQFTFELMDDPPNTTSTWESWFGLIAVGTTTSPASWAPKLAFYAMKRLMGHVSDPGAAFTTSPLDVTITGGDAGRRILLQRRDGTYKLILWRDVTVDSTGGGVTAQNVTVTFNAGPRSVSVYKPTQDAALATYTGVSTVTVPVDGEARIVSIV